jgi:hypothetical protein
MPSAEETVRQLGKGALESPPDPRDYKLSFLAGAAAPINWSEAFTLPEPPDTNQRSADCCTGESTSSYHWQLKGKRFSVHSIFAWIAQEYGAYLRDAVARVVSHGQETFQEAPDAEPKTYQNVRNRSDLTPADALDDRELRFFDTGGSIEQCAQAIRDWKGVIFGLYLSSFGWQDLTNPRPPVSGETTNGHALYGFGYHMHDGLKCIIAKSSFCGSQPGHHVHHIRENYFASGYVFAQAHVLVPKENLPMVRRYRFEDHGTMGVALKADGSFGFEVYLAKNEEQLAHLMADYEVPADAPVIRVP